MRVLGTDVNIETVSTRKARAALRALIRALTSVHQMVAAEITPAGEAFMAFTALIRLLSTVATQMLSQHSLGGKSLGASTSSPWREAS